MLQPPLRSRSRAATLCSCLAVLALAACSKGGGGGGPAAPEVVPELDPTPRFVSTATIRLTGKSLRAGSQIDVQGGTAPVTTTLEEKARNFDLEVPLHANRLNRLLLLERFAAGGSSPGLIVEVMCAALTGSNRGPQMGSFMLNDGKPIGCGQFFIAIEPEMFSAGAFTKQVTALVKSITAQEGARLPNSRRAANIKRLSKEGIPIDKALYGRLKSFA